LLHLRTANPALETYIDAFRISKDRQPQEDNNNNKYSGFGMDTGFLTFENNCVA
jgi:hypothetical protein